MSALPDFKGINIWHNSYRQTVYRYISCKNAKSGLGLLTM